MIKKDRKKNAAGKVDQWLTFYNINNPEFKNGIKTAQQQEAALRDQKLIAQLIRGIDCNDEQSISRLQKKIVSENVIFESEIGKRFDDELYEWGKELKEHHTDEPLRISGNKSGKQKNITPGSKRIRTEDKKKESPFSNNDPIVQQLVEQELKKKEKRRRGMLLIFAFLAVGCIGYFVFYYYFSDRSSNRMEELSSMIGSDQLSARGTDTKQGVTVHLDGETEEIPDVLTKYQTLYNSNRSLIGWLKIDDTIIDYPVMQCGDNTYYLSHNFDQEEDHAGSLFLDCNCDVIKENDNYIIYGHHMSSGKMFASLESYEKEDYYEKHPYIQFDTIYKEQTYQVMYVFRSRVYNEEDVVFKYYQFIDANSEAEFDSYMTEMAAESFYDTGVQAHYGDQLLTLSTCDYNETNGRFVVVAKRIK